MCKISRTNQNGVNYFENSKESMIVFYQTIVSDSSDFTYVGNKRKNLTRSFDSCIDSSNYAFSAKNSFRVFCLYYLSWYFSERGHGKWFFCTVSGNRKFKICFLTICSHFRQWFKKFITSSFSSILFLFKTFLWAFGHCWYDIQKMAL